MTTLQKVIKYCAIALAVIIIASVISGVLGGAARIVELILKDNTSDNVAENGESTEYSFSATEINGIYIDVEACNVTIVTGDTVGVKVSGSRVNVRTDSKTLKITEKSQFLSFNTSACSVTVTLSDVIDEAEISMGAGHLTIDGLSVRAFELDLGAGTTTLKNINVDEYADIDGGAGQITVENGTINSLDLDLGVGRADIKAKLTGNADIDGGVGALSVTLSGDRQSYSVTANKGIGSFSVDGQSISDGATTGNGTNKIVVDGGVGNIEIKFE